MFNLNNIFHNISTLSCRNIFIIIFLFISLPAISWAKIAINVQVVGVEDPLLANVVSNLRLYQYKDFDRVTENNLYQLYKQGKLDIHDGLAPFGYYSPKITSSLEKIDGVWQALYKIEKGRPVTIGKLNLVILDIKGEIANDISFNTGKLFSIGDVLEQEIYKTYKTNLLQRAFAEGYLDATFTEHKIKIYKERRRAHISLILSLGSRYKFGGLIIYQDVVTDELIQKYFPHKAGDPYLVKNIFKLQDDLYRSGIFEKVVVEGQVNSADENNEVPILIKAEGLQKLNKYTIGVGYATDTGARVTLGWTNRLVNKSGHSFSAGLQIGERDSSIIASYDMPFIDPRHQKITTSAIYQKQDWNSTETIVLAVGPAIVYSGDRYKYNFGLDFRSEDYEIGRTSGKINLLVPSIGFNYLFAGDGVTYRNSVMLDNGLSLKGSLRGTTELFLDDLSFLQLTVGARGVISPFENWRLIGSANIGLTEINDFDNLPPSLRFYAGGDNSVRGYGYKDIGSSDIYGNVIGGRYLFTYSVEAERSFTDYLAAAVFWDMGSATVEKKLDLHHGVGLGGRLNLPFGQVKFDIAWPISEEDKDLRLHFFISGEF